MPDMFRRIACALRCLFAILLKGQIPDDVVRAFGQSPTQGAPTPAPEPPATPAGRTGSPPTDPVDRAVQLLGLLQRDGRLIDFFTEEIGSYSDVQIGAAVRELHQNCRQVLERYLRLEPIIGSPEGQPVTVPAGFDPAAIRLIGNITGGPPVTGLLRHRGWRVSQAQLPPLPEGSGRSVVAPAEVEVE